MGANLGYGGAVNHVVSGLQASNDVGSEWVLVCNDDVAISVTEVARVIEATVSAPTAVATISAVTRRDTFVRLPGVCRGALRLAGLGRAEYLWERAVHRRDAVAPTADGLVAAGRQAPFWLVAIRLSAFQEAGGFAEVAPLYFEDVILQNRLARLGYRGKGVLVDAWHRGSESGKRASTFAIPAAVQGFVYAMSEVHGCSMRRGRLIAAVSCLLGLVVAAGRVRSGGARIRMVGLLAGVRWCLHPEPVELEWEIR